MKNAQISKDQFVAACVECAKDEILTDTRNGIVSPKCASFSELHDYVDANLYGGAALLLSLLGLNSSDDPRGFLFDATDVLNAAQNELNEWIVRGGLTFSPEALATKRGG